MNKAEKIFPTSFTIIMKKMAHVFNQSCCCYHLQVTFKYFVVIVDKEFAKHIAF